MAVNNEYQHFIPQFIVRNYAQAYVCPEAGCRGKKSRHRHEKGKFPGDMVVHHVNLKSGPLRLDETPVRRIFGQPGMYLDWGRATTHEQRRIESMLGKMESQASTVFRKISKAYDAGEPLVVLTRPERNLVRKFIFLLKYRGSGYHRRFYHETSDEYSENDKNLLRDYMKKHGYVNPMDVWFHNLETIVNLHMDANGEWIEQLPKQIYPDDAYGFINHTQMRYMAICRPSEVDEEFILTDNCYNVFEGRSTFAEDATTGRCIGSNHANLHDFAAISPKLMIVLRSRILPLPEEDHNPGVRQAREDLFEETFGDVYGTGSLLENLPISLPGNSYTVCIQGQRHLRPGSSCERGDEDKFYFKFSPIDTSYMRIINGILLDNAYHGTAIAFKSKESFVSTLDWFMGEPCKVGKIITGIDANRRLEFVKSLEVLSKSLGSTTSAVWEEMPNPIIPDSERFEAKHTEYRRILENTSPDDESHPLKVIMDRFCRLAQTESPKTFKHDQAQAGRMLRLETMIEIWSRDVNEEIRIRNRQLLQEAYMRLPCERVWLYLKRLRLRCLGDNDGTLPMIELVVSSKARDGPEDAFIGARNFVTPAVLNSLMYITVMNEIEREQLSFFSWWPQGEANTTSPLQQYLFHNNVLKRPGQIKNCGINIIEEVAAEEQKVLLRQTAYFRPTTPMGLLEGIAKVELLTRIKVRARFGEIMRGKMTRKEIDDLEEVFFDLTYPTPRSV